ncbi:MAG: Nif3-like dinuclear metal center hexameric protein [Candidatus Cloacimonetes bacterium]|jgi:dinuclear metal center YbgI/SA1388 family protein|nr:Nif3-like dinuclear metal center hexameric protein [Candidatus Cloacimonadota bacterium]MDD4156790.1 Nif3-like dinuclear metal center hexameric protein [Candidatus Cloacimonadota bacterium]
MLKVRDFYKKINDFAPFNSSYSWDNTGLLVGDMDQNVSTILISLDVTDAIVDYAISENVDLIISHHPIIFQALKSVTQKKILKIIANNISVICAHTNLDIAKNGLNYVLARTLDLHNIKTLSLSSEISQYQISVYVPLGRDLDKKSDSDNYFDKVKNAMHQAGAGIIGNYNHCLADYKVNGHFMPMQDSQPFIGKKEIQEDLTEIKIEMLCEQTNLSKVINSMLKAHPYETPVYYVIPLAQKSSNYGLGCYGELQDELSLQALAEKVKYKLSAPFVKLWTADKEKDSIIKTVAVCGGSGHTLIAEAKTMADVLITGDITYHPMLDSTIPLIDAGHFYTENIITDFLSDMFKDFDCCVKLVDAKIHNINKLSIII